MLLTCKECNAIYCIAEKIIGSSGRMVKCTRCQYVWMVEGARGINYPIELCTTLPILFKPALPKAFQIMPILLILILALISFIFFSEYFFRFQPLNNLYEKCAIYNSDGLLLDSFVFDLNGNELLLQGVLKNNSNADRIIPDMRYILLNKDKEVMFKYTHLSSHQLLKSGEILPINTKIINLTDNAAYLQLDIGNKLELLLK